MQNAAWRQQFRVALPDYHLIITVRVNGLRVSVVNIDQGIFYYQNYTDKNIPAASKYKFTSAYELYTWLEKFKDYPQSWSVSSQDVLITFETYNTLKMNLEMADKGDMWGMVINEILQSEQYSLRVINEVSIEVQKMKERQKERTKSDEQSRIQEKMKTEERIKETTIKTKNTEDAPKESNKINIPNKEIPNKEQDKSMIERIQNVKQQLVNQMKQQSLKIQQISQIQQEHRKYHQKSQQDMKQLRLQLQILQKTYNRNLITLKQQFSIQLQSTKQQVQSLSDSVMLADFDKIKRDTQTISQAFQNQIRIKDYHFQPDSRCLQINKKIYFLNNRTLKCMQDTKDYFKIASAQPLPFGRYQFRLNVRHIKNNGLLFGICSAKAKPTLDRVPFNDRLLLTINSCGYLTRQGLMTSFSAKIKSGDSVRMVVSKSTGEVKWYCNDVEIAGADLGELRKEELFVLVGLGNFGDEVELGDGEQTIFVQQKTIQSYSGELEKLNRKFGSSSRKV